MSRKRATLLTINGISASLSKVVISSRPTIPLTLLRNLSSAIERSDFWNHPNGLNEETPIVDNNNNNNNNNVNNVNPREFGGVYDAKPQKGFGVYGANHQKNGDFDGNLGENYRNNDLGPRDGVGNGMIFDRRHGNFDGKFGNFDGYGENGRNRWGMQSNREAGYGNDSVSSRQDLSGSSGYNNQFVGVDRVDTGSNGFNRESGSGSWETVNQQHGGDNGEFRQNVGYTRSGTGYSPSPGNYGEGNNDMGRGQLGYYNSGNSRNFRVQGDERPPMQGQGNVGHDMRNARLNQPIWSYANGNRASVHQTPTVSAPTRNVDVHQQFPSNPYVENTGFQQPGKHDYQPGKLDDFQSGRNENYLETGAQYQAIPRYNFNGNAGPYQQLPNGSQSASSNLQASVSGPPDEDSAEPQYIGTLEELDKACRETNVKEAVEILGLLDEKQIAVDLPRHLLLLKACAEAKALTEAKAVHEHLVRSLPPLDISTYNMIMETYTKCGSMQDAHEVFCVMPERNLTSWDTMITGLAKNGLGEDALDIFSQFKQAGLSPDGQMFIGVLAACGVLDDPTEGMLHFESMSKLYGIVPTMDHYVAIVDMLGTSGYLDETLEFIEKMPMEPSLQVWETLMNLCRIQGNLELGDRCAKIVEELDPSYLNESSKAGLIPVKASDVAKKDEKKNLGTPSLLEIKSKVHEFRAGDRSAPDTDKIYQLLKGLKEQMKDEGYVAETRFVLHDVQPEEKEEAIMAHSERLAAASSLMKTPARHEIRIIKNLRVCVDCHNAFKIISRIVGRKFIMRDAKRFHHMEDGKCSCNDYW